MTGNSTTDISFVTKCLTVLAIIAVVALAYQLGSLIMMIFASIVLAVILRTIANLFMKLKIPEGISVTLAIVSFFLIIIGLFYVAGDLMARQFVMIGQQLPSAIEDVQELLYRWGIDYDLDQASADVWEQIGGLSSQAGAFAMTAGGAISNLLLILAGAIFFAINPTLYRDAIIRLVPKQREELARETFNDSGRALGLWLQAQILSSSAVGLMVFVGLWAIGVPSPAALGLIAAAFDFIPYIGPILAGIPAVLVGLGEGWSTGLLTLGIFILVQQLQGNVLQPLIQKWSVDLPPAVLLFAVVAAGMIFGLLGVLVSAPLTVLAFVLVQRLYIGAVLGKPVKTPGPAKADIHSEGEE